MSFFCFKKFYTFKVFSKKFNYVLTMKIFVEKTGLDCNKSIKKLTRKLV